MIVITRGTINFSDPIGGSEMLEGRFALSLRYLMHELGHDLGLVLSAADIIDDPYVDTTGVVSHGFAILLLLDLQKHSISTEYWLCCGSWFVRSARLLMMGYR